jgi:hypothetical protein
MFTDDLAVTRDDTNHLGCSLIDWGLAFGKQLLDAFSTPP